MKTLIFIFSQYLFLSAFVTMSHLNQAMGRPIDTHHFDKLPACQFSDNGEELQLKTGFPEQRYTDFRAETGYNREDFAQRFLKRQNDPCYSANPQDFAFLNNSVKQLEVATMAALMENARSVAVSDNQQLLDHLAFLSRCLKGQAASDEVEKCTANKDAIITTVQDQNTQARQELAIGSARRCQGGPQQLNDTSFLQSCGAPQRASTSNLNDLLSLFGVETSTKPYVFSSSEVNQANDSLAQNATSNLAKLTGGVQGFLYANVNNETNTQFIACARLVSRVENREKLSAGETSQLNSCLRDANETIVGTNVQQFKSDNLAAFKTRTTKHPYLNFLSSSNPSPAEIAEAFDKTLELAKAQHASLLEMDFKDVARYPSALDQVIAQMDTEARGNYCQMASVMLDGESLQRTGQIALLGLASLASIPAGPLIATAVGVGASGAFIYDNNQRLEQASAFCQGNVDSDHPANLCNPETIQAINSEMTAELLFLPLAFVGSGVSTGLKVARDSQFARSVRNFKSDPLRVVSRGRSQLQGNPGRYVRQSKVQIRSQIEELAPLDSTDPSIIATRKVFDAALKDAETPAEISSLLHQMALLEVAYGKVALRAGSDRGALLLGMAISDVGKIGKQSRILSDPSPASDAFFNCLKLASTCDQTVLADLNSYMKSAGFVDESGKPLTFVNASQDNDTTRSIFSNAISGNLDKGANHELVGMAMLFEMRAAGELTSYEFQRAMHTNLFHNGPSNDGSFWGLLTNVFRPGAAKAAEDAGDLNVGSLADGTLYARQTSEGWVPNYRTPQPVYLTNNEGRRVLVTDNIVHTLADRAEGILTGSTKFTLENKNGNLPLTGMVDSMARDNARMTNTQFSEIGAMLDQQIKSGNYVGQELAQLKRLKSNSDTLSRRAVQIGEFMQQNIRTGRLEGTRFIEEQGGSIRSMNYVNEDGQRVTAYISDDSITVQQGQNTVTHKLTDSNRGELIDSVMAPLIDDLVSWERASRRRGANILDLMIK